MFKYLKKVINFLKFNHKLSTHSLPIETFYDNKICDLCKQDEVVKTTRWSHSSNSFLCNNCYNLQLTVNNFEISPNEVTQIHNKIRLLFKEKLESINTINQINTFNTSYPNNSQALTPDHYIKRLHEINKELEQCVDKQQEIIKNYNLAKNTIDQYKKNQ